MYYKLPDRARKVIARVLITLQLCALFAPAVAERAYNYRGYGDTLTMPACSSTVTTYSDSVYSMVDYSALRIVVQCRDTVTAGFASDSVKFHWGYRSFSLCHDSAGNLDTCYSVRVIVDTFAVDSFGVLVPGTIDGNSIANAVGRQVDTLSCIGFAVQTRAVFPEWDTYYRLWMQGLTGMRTGSSPRVKMIQIRRVAEPVRQR